MSRYLRAEWEKGREEAFACPNVLEQESRDRCSHKTPVADEQKACPAGQGQMERKVLC